LNSASSISKGWDFKEGEGFRVRKNSLRGKRSVEAVVGGGDMVHPGLAGAAVTGVSPKISQVGALLRKIKRPVCSRWSV